MAGGMDFDVFEFLKKAIENGASDIHIHADEPPVLRKDGKIIRTTLPPLTREDVETALKTVFPKSVPLDPDKVMDFDFSFEMPGVARFRTNLGRRLGAPSLVFRAIPYEISTFEQLGLPSSIENFAKLSSGIVLFTGPAGSGKSTTVASMIEYINNNESKHIVSIEDPIEFLYENKKGMITQRQVGVDTATYADGVKYALRQDPDVIFIGEIRDTDTMLTALKAAETGNLVLSTLHTNDAIQTINRIINMFEVQARDFVRQQLAVILRGTVSQKLLRRADGAGRVVTCEILTSTPTVQDFILRDRLEDIYELVKKGSFSNMITMNAHMMHLIETGVITTDEALLATEHRNELLQMLKGVSRTGL